MTDSVQKFHTFGQMARIACDYKQQISVDWVCKYWIPTLDSFLWWILDNELVVIWADTWCWKSDIAYNLSIYNAMMWKKVMLFWIEWDPYEPIYRYLQREINKWKEKNDMISNVDFRFNIWDTKDAENDIIQNIPQELRDNLLMYFKDWTPTVDEIVEHINHYVNSVDLIVIDHLHYINFWEWNEHQWISRVMRDLKKATDVLKKPIVLISHLRKRDKKIWKSMRTVDPTLDDLHGSSNIKKEATTAILISPIEKCYMKHLHGSWQWWKNPAVDDDRYAWTQMIIAKSRIWLPQAKLWMLYDIYWKKYADEFSWILEWSKATAKDALSTTKKPLW